MLLKFTKKIDGDRVILKTKPVGLECPILGPIGKFLRCLRIRSSMHHCSPASSQTIRTPKNHPCRSRDDVYPCPKFVLSSVFPLCFVQAKHSDIF